MSYFADYQKASSAFQRGDYRDSATQYLQIFTGIANKFDSFRWLVFHGFTSILQEEYFAATNNDILALKRVAENNHEAKLYRVEAYFTLGLLSFIRHEVDKAADHYRQAIRIADKTPEKERKKQVDATTTALGGNIVTGTEPRKVGYIVDDIRRDAKHNLRIMENFYLLIDNPSPPTTRQLRSDGIYPKF